MLPKDGHFRIVLFGSAPIQLVVAKTLMSSDVDLSCDEEGLEPYLRGAGLSQDQRDLYIQVCPA